MPAAGDSSAIKSTARVMDVLDLLARSDKGLSFTQLQESLAVPKSSLHGLLRTMTERGYTRLDEDSRRYRVGLRVWEAGFAYSRGTDLAERASPYLTQLAGAVGETVQLAVLDGLENVYIAKRDSPHPLRLVSDVGRRLPAHTTALGKVLLAGLDDEELGKRLDGVTLASYTSTTVTSVEELRDRLAAIRSEGFGEDFGEYTEGLYCLAVPINDGHGPVAAVSVSVPDARMRGLAEARAELLPLLRHTAAQIESAIRRR